MTSRPIHFAAGVTTGVEDWMVFGPRIEGLTTILEEVDIVLMFANPLLSINGMRERVERRKVTA